MPGGGTPPVGPGPVAAPSPNPGKEASSIMEVRAAVSALQKAFGGLDPGSEAGQAVLEAIKKLSKIAPAQQGAPGAGLQALRGLVQQAQGSGPMAAVQRMMAQSAPPQQPSPTPPEGGI